jgi:hypothetical protein
MFDPVATTSSRERPGISDSRIWVYRAAAWTLLITVIWTTAQWRRFEEARLERIDRAWTEQFNEKFGPMVEELRKACVGRPLGELEGRVHAHLKFEGPTKDPYFGTVSDIYRLADPPLVIEVIEDHVRYIWPDVPQDSHKAYQRLMNIASWIWGGGWAIWFVKLLITRTGRRVSAEAMGMATVLWFASKLVGYGIITHENSIFASFMALGSLAISLPATLWSWTWPLAQRQTSPADPSFNPPLIRGVFEHRPGIGTWLATIFGGLHPASYWRQPNPRQSVIPQSPAWLMVYAAIYLAPAIAAAVICRYLDQDVYPDYGRFNWIRDGLEEWVRYTPWVRHGFPTDAFTRSRMTVLVPVWGLTSALLPVLAGVGAFFANELSPIPGVRGERFRAAIYLADVTFLCSLCILALVLTAFAGAEYHEPAALAVLVSYLIAFPTLAWRLLRYWREQNR